jgi:hypothetical protein
MGNVLWLTAATGSHSVSRVIHYVCRLVGYFLRPSRTSRGRPHAFAIVVSVEHDVPVENLNDPHAQHVHRVECGGMKLVEERNDIQGRRMTGSLLKLIDDSLLVRLGEGSGFRLAVPLRSCFCDSLLDENPLRINLAGVLGSVNHIPLR